MFKIETNTESSIRSQYFRWHEEYDSSSTGNLVLTITHDNSGSFRKAALLKLYIGLHRGSTVSDYYAADWDILVNTNGTTTGTVTATLVNSRTGGSGASVPLTVTPTTNGGTTTITIAGFYSQLDHRSFAVSGYVRNIDSCSYSQA